MHCTRSATGLIERLASFPRANGWGDQIKQETHMEQLDWLPLHFDLSEAIKAARIQADPQSRLASALHLSGFRRDFVITERIDRLASDGLAELTPEKATSLGLTKLRLGLLGSHSL